MRNGLMGNVMGFLLGGVIGAAIGYLTAPRSGSKTRSMLNDKGKETLDRVIARVEEKRDQAEEMVTGVNREFADRTARLKKAGRKVMDREREILQQGVQDAGQAVSA